MSTVSVVIATYNRAAMVKQAMEAALEQTRPPDEIVVSDDASTDNTPAILADMAASNARLRVFRRAANSGGTGNWNGAMGQASGDFLALCSDDDRFLPGHLKASLAYLENHPEVGFVHSGFVDIVETSSYESRNPRRLRSQIPLVIDRERLIGYMTRYYDWPVHPSTIVMRREVWIRTNGFNPAYQLMDTDWFVRAVESFNAVLLPRYGVLNRRHPGNWSNRLGSAHMQREIFDIVEASITRLGAGRTLWRANVRARLGLTLFQRMRSGHHDSACALWHGLLQDTGRHAPEWIERAGGRLIRRWRGAAAGEVRHTVSPL